MDPEQNPGGHKHVDPVDPDSRTAYTGGGSHLRSLEYCTIKRWQENQLFIQLWTLQTRRFTFGEKKTNVQGTSGHLDTSTALYLLLQIV
jgi:hypothetical protein